MHGFRAALNLPCPNNRCHVVKDGVERRSNLTLITHDKRGNELPEPFYRCERDGGWSVTTVDGEKVAVREDACEYRTEPLCVTSSNMSRFVVEDYRRMPGRKRGERPTENTPERLAYLEGRA